jgi:YfiH family protein
MLQRFTATNGVVTYQSDLLRQAGVVHAFSTRLGGSSEGPYASMNLAHPPGDSVADPASALNYDRLKAALGLTDHELVWCHQVHGCTAATVSSGTQNQLEADALLTDRPTVLLSIRVADCVPILLAGEDGRAVAAVHAGWRGVVAGVVPRTIAEMRARFGIDPQRTLAAIGPCIRDAHFEVGPEVAAEFRRVDLAGAVVEAAYPKPHIDLVGAVTQQLHRAGIDATRIDQTDRCTYRDADEFFSHRRGKGVTGRMAAVIAARA